MMSMGYTPTGAKGVNMLESYENETKVLILHIATLELRLCLLEGLTKEDAISYTTASVSQSLGTMHNTLLPGDEVETIQNLVTAQYDRLTQRSEGEALRAS